MTGPRVLFYVQHLLGIGHLARASRIAAALADSGAAVTMVTGGLPVAGFPGPGIAHLNLPAVQADPGFSGLADAQGRPVGPAFLDDRRDRLLAAFHALAPEAVITEAFPFGRRQMRFELLPLLAAAEATRPRPLLLCSLRDIVQARAKPGRDAETVALVRAHYDRVLVHGDPAFAPLEASFPLTEAIADRLTYTGLVAPPPPATAAEGFDIVASAGGGAVGGALGRVVIAAMAELPGLTACLIAGPNLPAAERDELEAMAAPFGDRLRIETFRHDFAGLLAASRLSVSQAGYNTVCDILRAGCRAVLVPFALGGETEQGLRAARLAARGRAEVLAEDALSGPALAARIRAALAAPDPRGGPLPALGGAAQTARLITQLVMDRRKTGS